MRIDYTSCTYTRTLTAVIVSLYSAVKMIDDDDC